MLYLYVLVYNCDENINNYCYYNIIIIRRVPKLKNGFK